MHWSGRKDSNLRHPGPKPGALPGCATPRINDYSPIFTPRFAQLLEVATRGVGHEAFFAEIEVNPCLCADRTAVAERGGKGPVFE